MPRYHAESDHPGHVERFFHQRGYNHLRARKHGVAVIVESGPAADTVKHLRVRRDTVHLWYLDFADHRGRWERTPYRDNLDALLQLVIDNFSWTISPIHENPERTSDRVH